jgi:dolichol-phosphate mannosyltransferase
MHYSIVVPFHNEEGNVRPLYERLTRVMERVAADDYELVFVDDGSTDRTRSCATSRAWTRAWSACD